MWQFYDTYFQQYNSSLMKCVESVVHTGSQKKNERQHRIH